MFSLMAFTAQRNTVCHGVSKLRVGFPRLHMMGIQLAATLAAMLACVAVAFIDCRSPLFVFNRVPIACAALPIEMVFTARTFLTERAALDASLSLIPRSKSRDKFCRGCERPADLECVLEEGYAMLLAVSADDRIERSNLVRNGCSGLAKNEVLMLDKLASQYLAPASVRNARFHSKAILRFYDQYHNAGTPAIGT